MTGWNPRVLPGGQSGTGPKSSHVPGQDASDAELAGLALAGAGPDRSAAPPPGAEAFAVLVRRHEAKVLAVARSLVGNPDDARDVAQDAFLRAFRSLGSYRPEQSFLTWLLKITVNASRDELNRRRRRPRSVEGLPEGLLGSHEDADRALLASRVLTAAGELAPREREVFLLRDVQGFEVEEVAALLELEPPTVRRHLARARLRLRSVLLGSRPDPSAP